MHIETCSFPLENNKFNTEQCPICHEDFIDKQEISALACGHLFHSNCINTSYYPRFSCFVCNQPYWAEDLLEIKFKGILTLNVLHECALQILLPNEDARKDPIFKGISQREIETLTQEIMKRLLLENETDHKVDFCLSLEEEKIVLTHSIKTNKIVYNNASMAQCLHFLDIFFQDPKYKEVIKERNKRLVKRITKKASKLFFYDKVKLFSSLTQNEQDRLLYCSAESSLGKELRRWNYVRDGVIVVGIAAIFMIKFAV